MKFKLVPAFLLAGAAIATTLPQNQSYCILFGMCPRLLHLVDHVDTSAEGSEYTGTGFPFELAKEASPQSAGPAPIPTPVIYRNAQYGFCFLLPADWKGYRIVTEKWSGTVLDTQKSESGPQLLIRNPKWTKNDPWQDIPIMIFTPSQWKIAAADNMAVSAAPIGPAELGKNKSYVFALPPRWIGFTDAEGTDEVQTLMNQNPFQSPCGHKSTQPVANLP